MQIVSIGDQIVSIGDNLHEMPNSVNLSPAELAQRVVDRKYINMVLIINEGF